MVVFTNEQWENVRMIVNHDWRRFDTTPLADGTLPLPGEHYKFLMKDETTVFWKLYEVVAECPQFQALLEAHQVSIYEANHRERNKYYSQEETTLEDLGWLVRYRQTAIGRKIHRMQNTAARLQQAVAVIFTGAVAVDLRDCKTFEAGLTLGFACLQRLISEAGRGPRLIGEHVSRLSQFSAKQLEEKNCVTKGHPLDRPRLKPADGTNVYYLETCAC